MNTMDRLLDSALLAQVDDAVVTNNAGQSSGIWTNVMIAVAILAITVLPFVIGHFLAKRFRMPTYAFRIGAILFSVIAAASLLWFGELQYGVDLRGGTILVYELEPEQEPEIGPDGTPTQRVQTVTSADVIGALDERLNPSGTEGVTIRPYGERQFEIIVSNTDDQEISVIKKRISDAGQLQFAIVANELDHGLAIQRANELAGSRDANRRRLHDVTSADGDKLAFWVEVGRVKLPEGGQGPYRENMASYILRDGRTGRILDRPTEPLEDEEAFTRWVESQGVEQLEVLMAYDEEYDIRGEDLAFVSRSSDNVGRPAVSFTLTDAASGDFHALTIKNAPDGNRYRLLGIVLDETLLSAPRINSPISGDGQITGQFTREEVDYLVSILQAGKLPAAINKEPISENQIGSTLGADTISKGVTSIFFSLGCVLVFILIYYRFAGIVACLALALNLALTLGVMVLFSIPLTLPGLAGLVLTVGMSVDANVLIFERIREELSRGAAARMAIRNGFGKATVTIVDANLTTLITAIVLYAIGTDQVRGFAATLILGIIFSMFSAIYVSRTIFDIAERVGLMSLKMSDLVNRLREGIAGKEPINFLSKRTIAWVFSMAMIAVGIVGLGFRVYGNTILDIDFAGGTSVTFQLDQPMEADAVRSLLEAEINKDQQQRQQITLNRVLINGKPSGSVYKVDSSLDDVNELKDVVRRGFAATEESNLVTYGVELSGGDGDLGETSLLGRSQEYRLVALQEEETPEEDVTAASEEASPAAGEEPADAQAALGGETAEADTATAEEGAAESDVVQADEEGAVPTRVVKLSVADSGGDSGNASSISRQALRDSVIEAGAALGLEIAENSILLSAVGTEDDGDATTTSDEWSVALALAPADAARVFNELANQLQSAPVWLSSSEIGSRVASDMTQRAIMALLASLLFIIGYIWFRFQRVAFGLAAVAALIHDVLITLGAIAISYWLAGALGWLLIDEFKISLPMVAALLTIIGYSLNDTIVVFDRIRETRGKNPNLTADMINSSINQTLSRTLLTSLTTLIVVLLLYVFGGEGIHGFAFALLVGVLVGTYSSIFIASPTLLWLVNRKQAV